MYWDGPAAKRRGGDVHYMAFILGEERYALGGVLNDGCSWFACERCVRGNRNTKEQPITHNPILLTPHPVFSSAPPPQLPLIP